jgi:hypothetical protein
MDCNRVEGNWREIKDPFEEEWGTLTDDDQNIVNVVENSSKERFNNHRVCRKIKFARILMTGTAVKSGADATRPI